MIRNKKKLWILIIGILLLTYPVEARAKTIKEFEQEIEKYTKELEERKSKIAKNDAEIAQIKKNIESIEAQIKQIENETATLEKEIEESNRQIEKKSEESKEIMKYYQIASGENAYMEYAFGASTITDMIYRISIVEQMTEYNKQVMEELQRLIAENNQKKETLAKKKEEQKVLKKNLESEKARIDADTANLKAGMPGIEEQIKSAKSQLANAKSLGCGTTEDIQSCIFRKSQSASSSGGVSVPSTNGFYRPIEYGYITQYYKGCGYYNPSTGMCTGHIGMDIGSSNKTIAIYPIASGYVSAKYYDNAGALVLKIKHNYNGRYIYSTYAHLSRFAVSAGQYVTQDTIIGNMGSTGYSSGPHLHLEVTNCDWKSQFGGCSWKEYAKSSSINPASLINFPSRWNNR